MIIKIIIIMTIIIIIMIIIILIIIIIIIIIAIYFLSLVLFNKQSLTCSSQIKILCKIVNPVSTALQL